MKNIYLTGFMGTGKTAVGKELAFLTGMELIDMDDAIEAEQKERIPEIFKKRGEEAFRNMETELLARLAQRGGLIVSCGGGVPVRNRNVEIMKKSGVVLLLYADARTIYERVRNSDRPMLADDMSIGRIEELMEKRRGSYEAAADAAIDTSAGTPMELAKKAAELAGQV